MPQPAHITTRVDRRGKEHTMWECPNCHRTLGEIVGVRLVIVLVRSWTVSQPLHPDLQQSCPTCHVVSVLQESVIAS